MAEDEQQGQQKQEKMARVQGFKNCGLNHSSALREVPGVLRQHPCPQLSKPPCEDIDELLINY